MSALNASRVFVQPPTDVKQFVDKQIVTMLLIPAHATFQINFPILPEVSKSV
jgi:hypothetical protein